MGWFLDKIGEILKPVEMAGGQGKVITVEIVRPANTTAYTANDVVNDVAGDMLRVPDVARKNSGSFLLHGVELITDQGGGAQTWQPAVWLWQAPRVAVLADNAAFTGSYTIQKQAGLLDRLLLPALTNPAGSTIDLSQTTDLARLYACAPDRKDVYFDLQTLTAFTPGSGARYALRFHITQL